MLAKKTASGVRFYKKVGLGKFCFPCFRFRKLKRACRIIFAMVLKPTHIKLENHGKYDPTRSFELSETKARKTKLTKANFFVESNTRGGFFSEHFFGIKENTGLLLESSLSLQTVNLSYRMLLT
jgi:hypothetical protein